MDRRALAAALAVRLAVALTIRTAFAPDEYWQSIEVAHRLVFGFGHLTWEWVAGLRSYAHPLLFAAPYAVLKLLRLDAAWAVVRVPLLLQALAAAATDMYVAGIAQLLMGSVVGRWCLVCQMASWFNAYCLGRTYSNSLEAGLAAAGTYHWLRCRRGEQRNAASKGQAWGADCNGGSRARSSSSKAGGKQTLAGRPGNDTAGAAQRRHQRAWLVCAAASVVFRPSSALFWVLPAALELVRQRGAARWALLGDAAVLGGGVLGAAAVVDRVGYGRWVFVPWEFLNFNLLAGASAQYGAHPWHWNATQGLPTVTASLLPLLVGGLALAWRDGHARLPALLAAWSVACYTLPAHKEFRFLLPALQLCMPYCGLAAAQALGGTHGAGTSSATLAHGRGQGKPAGLLRGGVALQQGRRRWVKWGAVACLALQLPMAAYFCLVHQGAQVGVMSVIRREAAAAQAQGANTRVLFLTPCHATPYFSHLHTPLPLRFLDCSPPRHAAATAALNAAAEAWLPLPAACPALADESAAALPLSQRQCFERSPEAYLAALFEGPAQLAPHQRPTLLVGYGPLMQRLAGALRRWGYQQHARLRNCWVQTDGDSPCELAVWARQ